MRLANVEQRVTFGPFRMPHLQEQVGERFRRAFYAYLTENVMPLLDGEIVRIDGRVTSHYDQPQFASLTETRLRYYYEISLSSRGGVEEAWGELDYHPDTAAWTPSRVKAPRVRTLTEKRRSDQYRQAMLESRRHHPPRPAECPRCHSERVSEFIYGLPVDIEALRADLDSERICLGGCCFSEASPQWHCPCCGHEWGLTGYALALREIREQDRN